MKKFILAPLIICLAFVVKSQSVQYRLSMPEPHTHYFEVEMTVNGWGKPVAEIKMPVWAPGSYLVREFAKNVDAFDAWAGDKKLAAVKSDKNTWKVTTAGARSFVVKYKVYAFELSVRTSFLDDTHGFVSGTSVFMYVNGLQQKPGTLRILPHKTFTRISTSLEKNENEYIFPDYDILVDCPIEIGNQEIFYFDAAGVHHEVAMYGEGNYNVDDLKKGMQRIVEEATKVWGENPNKRYTFIVHNLTNSSGGLEHLSSTTLQVNRHSYAGSGLVRFLSLVAHEYFHLWNVKRMRPVALGPFDYDAENYTNMLWVCEGFTSYYDELLLKRAGYYDENAYLRSLQSTIGSIENTPGIHVQSLAESSHDAWIKGYRTNENSVNANISYYPKGNVIAALLDMEIIQATDGKKKLDDLLRNVYEEYYKKKKRGYTDAEFIKAVSEICDKNMQWFFDDYVYSTKKIDYNKHFGKMGYAVMESSHANETSLEIRTTGGSRPVITTVLAGGAGYESGLNVNDEIIAVDGIRVDENLLIRMVGMHNVGDEISILLARDNVMRTIKVKLKGSTRVDYQITHLPNEDARSSMYFQKWMN